MNLLDQSRERPHMVVDDRCIAAPEIAPWVWAIEDTRRRTLGRLAGLTTDVIDWQPPEKENSIGTLLYHIALIEADWLYTEVLEQPLPPDVAALFPWDARDDRGCLTQVLGVSLEQHLQRLATVRALLLQTFQHIDQEEFRRIRHLDDYDVTPEWVLHHLMQHEAEHRGEIGAMRVAAERA